jgi:LytS/YehU family sensor histidine kinase
MLVAVVIGTIIGFSVGNELARWITGIASPGFYRGSWRQAFALLIGSLVPGLVITYYFYSRETIAGKEAAIQTAQRQAAEHQLKLLESQLEPHMLFNTLANLRVLIGIDPPRAQQMLDQLIAFLRAMLNASRVSQHPLSAEFARLADYLALMKVRMGERLQTQFDLPADLGAAPVPALLLQPLVENCIKHGLEPNVAGGCIRVSAARQGDELVLQVRDTGAGLSDAHDSDGTRFGLVQVRERLATLYGERASLTLQHAGDADGGTLATIRLPLTLVPPPS